MRRLWRYLPLAIALAAPLAMAEAIASLTEQTQSWLRRGFDQPDLALAATERELAASGEPALQRAWQRTRALVAARAGRATTVTAALDALAALVQAGDPLAAADADLVRAVFDEQRGLAQRAADSATSAAQLYGRYCGPLASPRPDCDHHSAWSAAQILTRHANAAGERAQALAHSGAALDIARHAGDASLQAHSLAVRALLQAEAGDGADAKRSLATAQGLATRPSSADAAARADLQARVAMAQARVQALRDDRAAALRSLLLARRLAQQAGSPRLEAQVLAHLSDLHARSGRPREALAMVEAALPTARRHDDQRLERLLLHNGALAQIALGRVAEAKQVAERLIELWATGDSAADQATALREVADALAAAGDASGALDLFHREQGLVAQQRETRRVQAERALRERYDREAQQRSIELKVRDNQVQATLLHNRTLTQHLWAAAALALGLAAVLVGLLLKRMWATQRALQRSQAQLRQQSQRDPLTGLANRRHGQDALRAGVDGEGYRGALLLVDIDHFKHVNDGHGHAVGDQVLIEVARRLSHAVRAEDLVVRWGGEEFLVIAPQPTDAALDELAARLLRSVGATPIAVEGVAGGLAVTASIGYGAFPLAGSTLSCERALNLADMALYTAKSQGRNRAIGIAGLQAQADAATLVRVEADFERAWHDGLLRLAVQPGP